MEVFVGFCLASTRCTMKRDSLHVGTSRVLILTTAKGLRRDYNRKTSLCAKKSTKPRCLKKLSEPLQLCKQCYRAFLKLRQVTQRSSLLAKQARARSLLRGP